MTKKNSPKGATHSREDATQSREDSNHLEQVIIFDTTLRDGEQSPGASMTLEEKLEIARHLDNMGVDVIEAGFPVASPGDYEAVSKVAQSVKQATVCALARAGEKDIHYAAKAVAQAKKPRVHTFLATSPVHMKHKLQMSSDEVLATVGKSVRLARNLVDDVEWSPEDATRTEHDFLCRCVEEAIKAGARTINIPDTVGYATPQEYASLLAMLRDRVPNIDRAVLSVHCHDDLGMAVANSLSGLQAGARQVECTVNGIGERAGNAAMEEIVMAINTRNDALPYRTNVVTQMIARASKMVSTATAFPVQYNKAIVGKNAFAHESGIHQDGMLKNTQTYEIMTPESVGIQESSLVMGKHSGRHALREKAATLGYTLGDNQLADLFVRFKELADKKKHVFDEDIVAMLDSNAKVARPVVAFVSLSIKAGNQGPQEATLALTYEGKALQTTMQGNGPVDAVFNCIRHLVPHEATLPLYQVHAVTEGTDAQAEVSVHLSHQELTTIGRGVDTDTMVASAQAYIQALNKLFAKLENPVNMDSSSAVAKEIKG